MSVKPKALKKYNHAFSVAFEVESRNEEGEDITPEQYRAALIARANQLFLEGEFSEATGAPDDTYEIVKEDRCAPPKNAVTHFDPILQVPISNLKLSDDGSIFDADLKFGSERVRKDHATGRLVHEQRLTGSTQKTHVDDLGDDFSNRLVEIPAEFWFADQETIMSFIFDNTETISPAPNRQIPKP